MGGYLQGSFGLGDADDHSDCDVRVLCTLETAEVASKMAAMQ